LAAAEVITEFPRKIRGAEPLNHHLLLSKVCFI
jgi:hypothetical protein